MENLGDEIQLALRWNRPSILFAIHNSKAGQTKSQRALEEIILNLNQRVKRIEVEEGSFDLIKTIRETKNREHVVFFISGFEKTGNNAQDDVYRLLNMQREFLVENLIRSVFWFTKKEASKLPHLAPDFWAFRHRAVEFAPTRD